METDFQYMFWLNQKPGIFTNSTGYVFKPDEG